MNEDIDWKKFYLIPTDFGKRSCEQNLSFIISVLRTVFKKLVSVQATQSAMYDWEFEPVEDGSEVKHIPH